MKSITLAAVAVLISMFALPSPVAAQTGPGSSVVIYNGLADPCSAAWVAKQSVAVNISTATTTQLVALTANQSVYACGFYSTVLGTTSPSLLFVTGTGSACGTGTASLTGTMVPTTAAAVQVNIGGDATKFKGAVGGAVCLTTGGTAPNVQGLFVYVKR